MNQIDNASLLSIVKTFLLGKIFLAKKKKNMAYRYFFPDLFMY
jgi:hypothetical protein